MTTPIESSLAAPVHSGLATVRKCPGFYLLLLLFFFVVGFVNPVRELMMQDDWAYALTVRNLLTTGEYRLHDWAAANMPVQIYWGALLASLFGYTFTILRLSTLILLLVALVAFYWLLRDSGIVDTVASLLTLTLISSPAVLFLSFTFQTDVQFLGWQILALWLYSRAFRQQSCVLMVAASVAAFAAIGTRQFGAALVAGLLATWIIFEHQRWRKAPLYLAGLVLPLLITLWQFGVGVSHPTFSQKVRLSEQLTYMRDLPRFVADVLWRPTVILQYLGLFLLPLLPLLMLLVRNTWNREDLSNCKPGSLSQRLNLWLPGAWAVYLITGVCFGYFFILPRILMPYLAWLLPNSQTSPFGFKRHLALTILTSAFAVVIGWLVSRKYLDKRNWQLLSRAECFVMLSGLALLGLQLLYAQFYDVYLIQFLPFVLFALGKMAPVWPYSCRATTAALCLFMLTISSLWTRGTLAKGEASWRAAEIAASAGAAPEDVGGDMTWSCYHGAFDEWLGKVGGLEASSQYAGSHRMHFAFFDFLERRYAQTTYLVTSAKPGGNDSVFATIGHEDYLLRNRSIYVFRRSRL